MVEWKKIGEVCKTITPPMKLQKSDYCSEGLYPIIDQGQTDIVGYTNNSESLVPNSEYVLFGDHTRYVKYHKGSFAQGADGLKILTAKEEVNTRYFFFVFQNTEVPSRGYSRHWSIAKDLLIPIPSPSEQERIVGILDTFTSSIENLKEQIAQRRKQYEYYREQLLDIEEKEGVEMSFYANFVKDRIESSELDYTNYTSVENLLKDKAGRKDAESVPTEGSWLKYKKGDILIGNIRPYLRKIWLSDREGGTNGDVIVVRANDKALPQYLYFVLSSERFFNYYNQALKDGKMPRGEKNRVLSYICPQIDISDQPRIVSILDTFETSIHNLEYQLSQREKQYEYYRNKLLTFE